MLQSYAQLFMFLASLPFFALVGWLLGVTVKILFKPTPSSQQPVSQLSLASLHPSETANHQNHQLNDPLLY